MQFQESKFILVILLGISLLQNYGHAQNSEFAECHNEIFCRGDLLHYIQMARIFPDSKTFVDMSIKPSFEPNTVLEAFEGLSDKNNTDVLKKFVNDYFTQGDEFEEWKPVDYVENPAFLEKINDLELRSWAKTLHNFWEQLGRKVKSDVELSPQRYSMIYAKNGVIVPGGRFKEFYYWDSYWIQTGLLHSEMKNTTKGMLENFLDMVDTRGFVPNGGRIYFTRSQPPLLIPMVKQYFEATNDKEFISKNIPLLEREFKFWIEHRNVTVFHEDKDYLMVRYNSEQTIPRPESYKEDYELAEDEEENLTEEEKYQLYSNLHSGAESGWDFSSRWWIKNDTEGHLKHTKTTDIVPVDLNALMYLNARTLAEFYTILGQTDKVTEFENWANDFREAIEEVLWDEEQGSWFDYDTVNETLRNQFFYQSNIVPLWAGVNDDKASRFYQYLLNSKSLQFVGGVPTSLQQTGEQWDFPNGWAPLQHFFVDTLSRFDESKEMAFQIAKNWLYGNYKAYLKAEKMFEKYDVTYQGLPGGGGEYDVVVGFGWTNGVVLDFLARYGDRLPAPHIGGASQFSPFAFTTIALGTISIVISSYWG